MTERLTYPEIKARYAPEWVLNREHGYLTNNKERMDYPRYRRAGLPLTSSPIESWVK